MPGVAQELELSSTRVNDLRLCLALEVHPGEKSPAFREAINSLRMKSSNDSPDRAQARQQVDDLVKQLGLVEYVNSHLTAPPESEYFTKMQAFLPGLYIGSAGAASDRNVLLSTGITHVCMCLNGGRAPFPSDFKYCIVDVLDIPEVKIGPYFDESYEFIRKAVEDGGKVLIHCAAGVSRSASIAIAYLMRDKKMSYEDSLQVLRAVRPFVSPNDGFKIELLEFEAKLMEK